MKTMITAKLQLCATQLAYRDALNFVSQYAHAHGNMSNKVALQDGTYDEVRRRFHLPSQMACSVPRQVGATYKALWTKVKHNDEHRKAGLLFVCQKCHYTLHADLVRARNLAMRTLLVRQDWASTGVLSEHPDVSSVETKAARLQRYAELRWSLDTSPRDVFGDV
jgi:hypothetical protein